jgi:hypothetical protein
MRRAIMEVFVGKGDNTPVSPREVSGVLGQPLSNVSYHVRLVTGVIMALINEDIANAVTAGTFDGDENHISRTPMLIDAESYDEPIAHMTLMLEGIFAIKERAANRIQKDTPTISTVVNLIQFDLPSPRRGFRPVAAPMVFASPAWRRG